MQNILTSKSVSDAELRSLPVPALERILGDRRECDRRRVADLDALLSPLAAWASTPAEREFVDHLIVRAKRRVSGVPADQVKDVTAELVAELAWAGSVAGAVGPARRSVRLFEGVGTD